MNVKVSLAGEFDEEEVIRLYRATATPASTR